jgi:hypothetical protein
MYDLRINISKYQSIVIVVWFVDKITEKKCYVAIKYVVPVTFSKEYS